MWAMTWPDGSTMSGTNGLPTGFNVPSAAGTAAGVQAEALPTPTVGGKPFPKIAYSDPMSLSGEMRAIDLSNTACSLMQPGTYDEAIRVYKKCLNLRLKTKARDMSLAVPVVGIADCLQHLGQLDRAEHVLKQGLDIRMRVYGGDMAPRDIQMCLEIQADIDKKRRNGEDVGDEHGGLAPGDGALRCDALACGAPGARLLCSRCKGERYCSKACQKAKWGRHKAHCEKPASVPATVATPAAKLPSGTGAGAAGTIATVDADTDSATAATVTKSGGGGADSSAAAAAAQAPGAAEAAAVAMSSSAKRRRRRRDNLRKKSAAKANVSQGTASLEGQRGAAVSVGGGASAAKEVVGAAPTPDDATSSRAAEKVKLLEERLAEREESELCAVCLDHPRDMALVPCGHQLCSSCVKDVCPIAAQRHAGKGGVGVHHRDGDHDVDGGDACPLCRAEVACSGDALRLQVGRRV